MRKNRIITLTILLAVMLCAVIAVCSFDEEKATAPAMYAETFSVDGGVESVRVWHNGAGDMYLFLPPYAQALGVRLRADEDARVTLDGKELGDGALLGDIEQGRTYRVAYEVFGKRRECTLTVMRQSGLGCTYIDTESGSMDYINLKKDNSERGSIRIYSPDGECEYAGSLASVSGRGNYTWLNFDKKPYNIELSSEAELLGMEAGRKWILLANASDASMLRGELVLSYARRLGLSYTPDTEWTALYLNGEYAGLYQLCERIETGYGRVDIPADGVLVSTEAADNADTGKNTYFTTEAGTLYRVRSSPDAQRTAEAAELFSAFERAVMSDGDCDPVTGARWQDMIDIDSFARKYLIEEMSANHDAGYSSGYFYVTQKDGRDVIFAGPVWDYDLSMGNSTSWQLQYPESFFADREYIKDDVRIVIFSSLCKKSEFDEYVRELYRRELSPLLRQELEKDTDRLSHLISASAVADAVRYGRDTDAQEKESAHMLGYMSARTDFLDSLWIEGTEYYRVRMTAGAGGYYAYAAVRAGEAAPEPPTLPDSGNTRFAGWFYEGTDEPYDPDAPVNCDIALYARREKSSDGRLADIVKAAPAALLGLMLCALGIAAFIRMRRGE